MQVLSNVMLDLETLGTRPGCVVLSIGAVFFGPEGLGAEFHMVIDRASSEHVGLVVSPDTLDWWGKQSIEARKTLLEADGGKATDVKTAFVAFNSFLALHSDSKKVKLWGNGADFDNVILLAAFEKAGIEPAWGNYNSRCYRTLKNLKRDIQLERQGTYHNALDDAKSQALHAIKLLEALNA